MCRRVERALLGQWIGRNDASKHAKGDEERHIQKRVAPQNRSGVEELPGRSQEIREVSSESKMHVSFLLLCGPNSKPSILLILHR